MNKIAPRGDSDFNVFKKADGTKALDVTDNTIRILVVDDKPNIIKQLTEMFAKSNWQVEGAKDEQCALDACEHSHYSAILISMALPDDSAIDLREN